MTNALEVVFSLHIPHVQFFLPPRLFLFFSFSGADESCFLFFVYDGEGTGVSLASDSLLCT